MRKPSTIRILAVLALLAMSGLTAKAQWTLIDSLPTPRGFTTAQEIDGKIYVIGGAFNLIENTSIVEVFDPFATDGNRWDTVASLPVPISAAASATVNGKIYVFGGVSEHNSPLWYDSVYEFDPDNGPEGTWTLIDTMPKGPRAFLTACAVGNLVYVIGGRTPSQFSIRRVERYNTLTKDWETLPDLIIERSNPVSGQLHGIVYAIGGVGDPTNVVEKFDGTQWTVATTDAGDPISIDIWWGGSVTYGGNLYALGGIANSTLIFRDATLKFNPHNGVSFFASGPWDKAAFGTAILPTPGTEDEFCIFALGGILEPFFSPTVPGPAVSGTVLAYCDALSAVKDVALPDELLSQNTPNPFSTQTTIAYELKKSANVSLQVFDLTGRAVATLQNGYQGAGAYTATWDASGLPAGIYLYQLKMDEGVLTRKCVLQN